jgi:hypothetical protein
MRSLTTSGPVLARRIQDLMRGDVQTRLPRLDLRPLSKHNPATRCRSRPSMHAYACCSACLAIALLIAATNDSCGIAAPLPQPKPVGSGGSCPHGHLTCAPAEGAQDAVLKPPDGTCPFGWLPSGSFCLRSGATLVVNGLKTAAAARAVAPELQVAS